MRRDREFKLFRRNPTTVVADANQLDSAPFNGQFDVGCPRVNAVFKHLFDDAGRSLNNFASSNFVNQTDR